MGDPLRVMFPRELVSKRGVASCSSTSNRKVAGATNLRLEKDPALFAQMCKYVAKAEQAASSQETFEEHLRATYKYTPEQIAWIREREEFWRSEVAKLKVGKQAKNMHLRLGEQEYDGDFTIRIGFTKGPQLGNCF